MIVHLTETARGILGEYGGIQAFEPCDAADAVARAEAVGRIVAGAAFVQPLADLDIRWTGDHWARGRRKARVHNLLWSRWRGRF